MTNLAPHLESKLRAPALGSVSSARFGENLENAEQEQFDEVVRLLSSTIAESDPSVVDSKEEEATFLIGGALNFAALAQQPQHGATVRAIAAKLFSANASFVEDPLRSGYIGSLAQSEEPLVRLGVIAGIEEACEAGAAPNRACRQGLEMMLADEHPHVRNEANRVYEEFCEGA